MNACFRYGFAFPAHDVSANTTICGPTKCLFSEFTSYIALPLIKGLIYIKKVRQLANNYGFAGLTMFPILLHCSPPGKLNLVILVFSSVTIIRGSVNWEVKVEVSYLHLLWPTYNVFASCLYNFEFCWFRGFRVGEEWFHIDGCHCFLFGWRLTLPFYLLIKYLVIYSVPFTVKIEYRIKPWRVLGPIWEYN